MKKRKPMRVPLGAIETLLGELRDIRSTLPSPGERLVFSMDEDSDDAPYVETVTVDSSEIEVSLQAAISSAIDKLDLDEEPSSLTELMEKLFSEEDDLVSIASDFEDSLNGYFGELFGESLGLARGYLDEIISILSERLKKWTTSVTSQQLFKNEQ